jgi:hypothetical protein
VGLEQLLSFEAERIGSLLKRYKHAILQGECGLGRRATSHGANIVVMTTNVKRKEIAHLTLAWPWKGPPNLVDPNSRAYERGGDGFRLESSEGFG